MIILHAAGHNADNCINIVIFDISVTVITILLQFQASLFLILSSNMQSCTCFNYCILFYSFYYSFAVDLTEAIVALLMEFGEDILPKFRKMLLEIVETKDICKFKLQFTE